MSTQADDPQNTRARCEAAAKEYNATPRWQGPSTDIRHRKPPLSNECLAALREAAAGAGHSLTDKERAEILQRFQ